MITLPFTQRVQCNGYDEFRFRNSRRPVLAILQKSQREGVLRGVINVAVAAGCGKSCVRCSPGCFANKKDFHWLSGEEIAKQADYILAASESSLASLNIEVHFNRMGDPLYGGQNLLSAIEILKDWRKKAKFVIKTYSPRLADSPEFFDRLRRIAFRRDLLMELHFSYLCTGPRDQLIGTPAMPLADIAKIVKKWKGERVVLEFLVAGFEYDAGEVRRFFDPNRVFIKLSRPLKGELQWLSAPYPPDLLERFSRDLQKNGFTCFRAEKTSRLEFI